jgi:hypothetical protein
LGYVPIRGGLRKQIKAPIVDEFRARSAEQKALSFEPGARSAEQKAPSFEPKQKAPSFEPGARLPEQNARVPEKANYNNGLATPQSRLAYGISRADAAEPLVDESRSRLSRGLMPGSQRST